MSLLTDIEKAWAWLKSKLATADKFTVDHVGPLAVTIGQAVKNALDNSTVVDIIETVASALKVQGIADQLIEVFKLNAPRLISFGLILEAPPVNASPEEKAAWISKLFNVWTTNQHIINRAQFFTVFTAQMAQLLELQVPPTQNKFAYWAQQVETAWTDYQQDLSQYGN